jgi:hypothetical protein
METAKPSTVKIWKENCKVKAVELLYVVPGS